jgi:Domain of unknown function (DUF4336)
LNSLRTLALEAENVRCRTPSATVHGSAGGDAAPGAQMTELRDIAEGLWVCDRAFSTLGVQSSLRMVVIRLGSGELFLHSPVALNDRLKQELDALGPVRHVVAPNMAHHLFISPYSKAFPDATLWGAPGLKEKVPALPLHRVLSEATDAPWSRELDQLIVAGIPRINEVAFLHRPSRSLLLTDLAIHFPHSQQADWWTRAVLKFQKVYDCPPRPSAFLKHLTKDEPALRASVDRLLSWDFDRLVLAHGDIFYPGGRETLRAAFDYLGH